MSTRTLLLSPWYFPLKVLRWEDAVKMRYEGTVDVVAEYDEEISSPSLTWKTPAVVRLRRMPRTNKLAARFSRQNVYQRDGYECQYCPQGRKLPVSELSYDHVVPRAAGGRTCWENIVTSCRSCNTRKGSKTCDEAGMWPRNAPYRPRTRAVVPPRIDPRNAPAEWHAFLPATA